MERNDRNRYGRRAKKGGEVGVNGEWYEGGKFIANTDRPKGRPRRRGTGRMEIEPYKWEVPPAEGLVAIYPNISVGYFAYDREANKFGEIINEVALGYSHANDGADVAAHRVDLRDRYNAGERWMVAGTCERWNG